MAGKSLNKVILLGNLTRDPELKYTPKGTAVCSMGLATNRTWVADGQTKEDVQYHNLVAWNKLAELCGKLMSKGKKIYVEGRLAYRDYTGKDGVARKATEIVIDDFILLSSKDGDYNPSSRSESHETSSYEPEQPSPESEEGPSADDGSVNPDDIPF